MSLSLNKILLANAATNTAGAYLQGITISSIGIGNTTLMNAGTSSAQFVPAGAYILPQTTNNVTIVFWKLERFYEMRNVLTHFAVAACIQFGDVALS